MVYVAIRRSTWSSQDAQQIESAVRAVARRFINNSHDLDDVVQGAVMKIFTARWRYRRKRGSWAAFCMQLARNHCVDVIRSQRGRNGTRPQTQNLSEVVSDECAGADDLRIAMRF